MRWLARGSLVLGVFAFSACLLEVGFRLADGWPLWGALSPIETPGSEAAAFRERPDLRHLTDIRLADGVRRDWFNEDPVAPARVPMDPALAARATRYASHADVAFTVWNRSFLKVQVCAGVKDYGLGALDDVYVFDPVEPGTLPLYRYLPSASPPSWFVTNRFGWRGPDLELNKDGRTIRIAFAGASTTVARYTQPFSYPEFVGHWLNRWLHAQHSEARVEIINAARTGIDSFSIDAIVRQEVAPLEPDLVVYYEGANGFAPARVLRLPAGELPERPTFTFRPPTRIERVSALARRVVSMSARLAARDGREPSKPTYPVRWTAGVDEYSPDPDARQLPMGLERVVENLDSMRKSVTSVGGELAIASFIWLVPDPDAPLDLRRHLNIHTYLNRMLWPARYAHIRRMADFQNRVLHAYAEKRHTWYVEVAATFPQDPDLFDDPIHLEEPGLRLQAWVVLQQLVPWLSAKLATGSLPRPMRNPRDRHPALGGERPGLVSIDDVRKTCG